jgi:diguanylate cyclase (GGDEF) domain
VNILIFGPNGSGKGTQGDLIKQKYNLAHIESGAIFREHIGGGTELGKKAKAFIDRGDLVPDDITIPMGDKAIFDMAQILRRNFRGVDIVGRIGGDEFLVFCTEKMTLSAIHERARLLVAQLHTQCTDQQGTLTLTASVGVACCPMLLRCSAERWKRCANSGIRPRRSSSRASFWCIRAAQKDSAGIWSTLSHTSDPGAACNQPEPRYWRSSSFIQLPTYEGT